MPSASRYPLTHPHLPPLRDSGPYHSSEREGGLRGTYRPQTLEHTILPERGGGGLMVRTIGRSKITIATGD